ncbi:MAG: hypothetical protein K2P88_11740 [Chitinophagaceae bacterium]|uniref:hypothetical protein n=1 Tax=unclassified Paraflavitalea TaxID=2798305 RepID=UPI003D32870D|nr:hypothetical protein [Chitinophagaceae bacterium]
MKKVLLPFNIVVLVLLMACSKKSANPDSRHFYMGTTPWPADFTVAEVDTAYKFINTKCDLVSHHFDEGIPYEEAYTNKNWPSALNTDLLTRITKVNPGKKVLLSVAPLNLSRKSKADYYATSTMSDSIKNVWRKLPINDPKVVAAYVNYIGYLANNLQPSFINYGVESNSHEWNSDSFRIYKSFVQQVYDQLKSRFPNTPIFLSFMVSEAPAMLDNAIQLVPYTDYFTLSAYPYTNASSTADGNTDPAKFPADYFERFLVHSAGKPIAFAETSFIAEPLKIPSFLLDKQGNEAWQAAYLEKVIGILEKNNGVFLVWFCSKDYDAGTATIKSMGLFQDLFLVWQDTGLKDQTGREREAFRVWSTWYAKYKL